MMITDDPNRDFDAWDAERERKREKYEKEEARICLSCGMYSEKPYYDVYPDERDGVICKDCAQSARNRVKGILKWEFISAIEDAMDHYYKA